MRKRLVDAPLTVLALLGLAALVVHRGAPQGDLANYHVAARLFLDGVPLDDLYDYRWFTDQAARLGYGDRLVGFPVLTPPSALLLAPVAWLEPEPLARLWQVVQGLLLGLTAVVLAATARRPPWWGALPLLALLPAVDSHLRQGQAHLLAVAGVALAGLVWGVRAGERPDPARQAVAGVALGLAVGLKVHAWPLLLLAALARQGWLCLAALATLAAGAGLSVALLGPEVHAAWLSEIAPASATGMFVDPWHLGNQSLGHALRRAVLAHPALNPSPALPDAAWLLSVPRSLLLLMVGLSVLPALRWERLSSRERAGAMAAASTAALIAGPLLARYHLLLLAPGLAWVLSTLPWRRGLPLLGVAALALHWPVPTFEDPGGAFLLAVPRFWLCLLLWALLLPWRVLLRADGPRGAVAALLAVALGLLGLPRPAPPADPSVPVDHPDLPLVASELVLAPDGALLLSGLTAHRQGHPGRGWVVVRWLPEDGPPEILGGDPGAHAWAPRTDGRWSTGATGYVADASRLPVPVPGHHEGAVHDPVRGGWWFLSDQGVGVRALRLRFLPDPAGDPP